MKCFSKFLWELCVLVLCGTSAFGQAPRFLVTNNQNPGPFDGYNALNFYTIAKDGELTFEKKIHTHGVTPGDVANFSRTMLAVAHGTDICLFAGEGGYPGENNLRDVAAVDEANLKFVGRFQPGPNDFAFYGGVGLVSNGNYLYAGFSGQYSAGPTGSIVTYRILAGCKLSYVSSVPANGTGLIKQTGQQEPGGPEGLALSGHTLVVSYQDGSISSFNVSSGVPVDNRDLQNSTGAVTRHDIPQGVDITKDGKFAIFASTDPSQPVIEVSDISKGKLEKTVVYALNSGKATSSILVELSPDESLLYILNEGNQFEGTVTTIAAGFFNKQTGEVSFGCDSDLKALDFQPTEVGSMALADNTRGTGGQLYIGAGELQNYQAINIVQVQSNGKTCSLTEIPNSPIKNKSIAQVWPTLATWPPRAF